VILTPRFEASLLHIPTTATQADVVFAEWAEDGNPYDVVANIITAPLRSIAYKPTQVFVDEGARHFVVDGIAAAVSKLDYQVHNTPNEITAILERNPMEEIQILRCANEVCYHPTNIISEETLLRLIQVTLQALRLVRSTMYIGMRESEAQAMIRTALTAAGLKDGDGLVLLGGNNS